MHLGEAVLEQCGKLHKTDFFPEFELDFSESGGGRDLHWESVLPLKKTG